MHKGVICMHYIWLRWKHGRWKYREGRREEGGGGRREGRREREAWGRIHVTIYFLTFSSTSMLVVLPPLAHFVVVVVVVSSLSHQGEEKACLSCEISLVVDTPCIRG